MIVITELQHSNVAYKHAGVTARVLRCVLSVCLAAGLCLCGPSIASADVRKSDIVYGSTVESRNFTSAQCPIIDAEYALVLDTDGTIYFERNSYDATQIASITKIMTAIVALEEATSDTVVVTSLRAATVGESSASLQEGDVMSLETALKALLLSSGNDAAIAIAETVGRLIADDPNLSDDESYKVFVERMNARAEELGCIDTVFENPHGLDDGEWAGSQHSCASDVAIMAKAAMSIDSFRSIVATAYEDITVTRADGSSAVLSLESTDEMLKDEFEGACGIKTGYTSLAGWSFAGAANRDGVEMYAIVINSTTEDQRFTDAETLLDWVYEHRISYALVSTNESMQADLDGDGETETVPVLAEVAHTGWINRTVRATVADASAEMMVFDLNGNVSQSVEYYELKGNVAVGDVVGTITYKQRNDVLVTLDLIAAEDVSAPNVFQDVAIWWKRVLSRFTGASRVAESVFYNETPLIVDKTS